MAHTFNAAWQKRTSAPILAAKSFYGQENFVTCPKWLFDEKTLANLSKKRLELRLSLEHFNQPLLSSNIYQESGKEIVKRSGYWESRRGAREFWTSI